MKSGLRIFCLLFFLQSFSQNASNQEKISTLLHDYFASDREIIHVQFNKMLFVNNEYIAYKGYVLDKNTNSPNYNTTNVQLVVYNDKQEIVQKQLLYASKGTFDGNLKLSKKFTSGKYFFQFYTNWMNNFREDDSFIQTIEIVDTEENYKLNSPLPNLVTASIAVFPENGILINGISNTVGIKVTDCNQIGITTTNGIVVDSKSNEVAHFTTNKMGNSAVYFIPELNEKYFVKINLETKTISQELPLVQNTGLIISYNNILPNNILAIDVHTNDLGVEQFQKRKFNLVVHQNNNAIQKDISFDNKATDQIIRFDKKLLSNGINSIRVLDENQNEIAQRLIYINKTVKQKIDLEAKPMGNDSIALYGKVEAKFANLSLSVLPEENIGLVQKRTIQGTFLLNAYLENPVLNDYAYFDPENSSSRQDLELLMLNQTKSKFHWQNILAGAPKIDFPFKRGITVNGTVEKNLNPKISYKMSLISFKDNVFEEANLDADNKFEFKNFYARDSTSFLFQLSGEKNKTLRSKIFAHIIPQEDRFFGKPNFEKSNCPVVKSPDLIFNFKESFAAKNTIALGNVVVENKFKKEVFLHKDDNDNINATAYKIDNDYGTVLNWLSSHGYKSELDSTNTVSLTSNRSSMNNGKSPDVYIDDFKLMDLDPLFSLNMFDVDEIYIDKMGFLGSPGSEGVIKIYMKTATKKDFYDPKFSTLIVTSAFAKKGVYKNSEFETPKEFFAFGTLKWNPKIPISENQEFNEKVVKGNQKNIQVYLEGFDEDGNLYSEIKNVPVSLP